MSKYALCSKDKREKKVRKKLLEKFCWVEFGIYDRGEIKERIGERT